MGGSVELKRISINPKENELLILAKTKLGDEPTGVDLRLITNTTKIAGRVNTAVGSGKLAELIGEHFNVVDLHFIHGNIQSYSTRKIKFIPRVHFVFYTKKGEDPIECLKSGCALLGYAGLGPNVPIGESPTHRVLARHTEGGVLTNIYSHGSTVAFGKRYLEALRHSYERIQPQEVDYFDKIVTSVIRRPSIAKHYKRAIIATILEKQGIEVPEGFMRMSISEPLDYYREMFYMRKPVERMEPIPGLPPLHLGYTEGELWVGLPCEENVLCHAIRPAIRLVGPFVAAENSDEYLKLLVNEFLKTAEDYYSHVRRMADKHGIVLVPPPKGFYEFVENLKEKKNIVDVVEKVYSSAEHTMYRLRKKLRIHAQKSGSS